MANKRNPINTIEDLHREKIALREKVQQQEIVLKEHYRSLSEKVSPALKIANFISGNAIFRKRRSDEEEAEDEDQQDGIHWIMPLAKILLGALGGKFLYKRTRKNFGRAILSYAMDQGMKKLAEKDISFYIDKLKELFFKKEEKAEAEGDENDVKE